MVKLKVCRLDHQVKSNPGEHRRISTLLGPTLASFAERDVYFMDMMFSELLRSPSAKGLTILRR